MYVCSKLALKFIVGCDYEVSFNHTVVVHHTIVKIYLTSWMVFATFHNNSYFQILGLPVKMWGALNTYNQSRYLNLAHYSN